MSFKTALCLKIIGNQAYEITEPLIYNDGIVQLTVHQGFDFDGASVPQALWSFGLSPMTGGYQRSACLHDALYASQSFDRKICDELFLEAMQSDGVGYFKRYAMYNAVRLFGASSYANDNKEEVNAYRKFITHLSLV